MSDSGLAGFNLSERPCHLLHEVLVREDGRDDVLRLAGRFGEVCHDGVSFRELQAVGPERRT